MISVMRCAGLVAQADEETLRIWFEVAGQNVGPCEGVTLSHALRELADTLDGRDALEDAFRPSPRRLVGDGLAAAGLLRLVGHASGIFDTSFFAAQGSLWALETLPAEPAQRGRSGVVERAAVGEVQGALRAAAQAVGVDPSHVATLPFIVLTDDASHPFVVDTVRGASRVITVEIQEVEGRPAPDFPANVRDRVHRQYAGDIDLWHRLRLPMIPQPDEPDS